MRCAGWRIMLKSEQSGGFGEKSGAAAKKQAGRGKAMFSRKKKDGQREGTPSVRENYAYNLIYQILTLLTPLITTPYIARVLGTGGVGIQSYTSSVVQYFSILAALGTASYGQREIARNRDDREARSRVFWEIELLCAGTTALCLMAWMAVIAFSEDYGPYYGVLTMTLAAVAFDISWMFGGMEQYRIIVIRNTAIKLAGIAMMFLFVRDGGDLLLYIALLAATGLLGNISMWACLRQFVDPVDIRSLKIRRHMKEVLVYFVPTIATSVYTILDKTMIGWFSGSDKSENGYYEYATGFVNMAKILIISFNAVMSARMSYLFGAGRQEEIRRRIGESVDFVLLLGLPITFGLAGIAACFVPWFLGGQYSPVIRLLWLCSPLVLIVGFSDCMGSQILTPCGKRAQSARVIVAGACANACMNLLLIPRLGAMGAALASVLAETMITGLYFRLCRGYIRPGMIAAGGIKRLAAALVMFGAVVWFGNLRGPGPLTTAVQVAGGACVYFVMLLILGDKTVLGQLRRILGNDSGEI